VPKFSVGKVQLIMADFVKVFYAVSHHLLLNDLMLDTSTI
jgi:hypothetical protein